MTTRSERNAMLALAERYEKFGVQSLITRDEIKTIVSALRLAATPLADLEMAERLDKILRAPPSPAESPDDQGPDTLGERL
jgi:hypothetical protein